MNKTEKRKEVIKQLKKMANILKELVYCAGEPIAQDVIEKPCRSTKRYSR